MTKFETLANEVLDYVFKFLNTDHLIEAFYGLNCRFDNCIHNHIQNNQLNFECLTKKNLGIICEEYLSSIIDQIKSVRIANNTLEHLSEYSLFHDFTFDRFLNLKSLSLCRISSIDTVDEIILQCYHFSHLNRLDVIDCYTENSLENIVNTNNNIWNLPKLRYFTLNESKVHDSWLYRIGFISFSIEYLTIKNIDDYSVILHYLFKIVPRLRQLTINDCCWSKSDRPQVVSTNLSTLVTSFFNTNIYPPLRFIRGMPNLCNLTLELGDIYMNGYQWEKLFINNFPKIKTFQLKMNRSFSCNTNIEEQIEYLVDSFRTSFWIKEHHWFIQCDYYYVNGQGTDVLYTLPNHFDKISTLDNRYSKSTDSSIENMLFSNRVQFFNENSIKIHSFNNLNVYTNDFPNLDKLELSLPFDDAFNSNTLSLRNLAALHVTMNDALGYDHLQILLDQSPKLNSLKFNSFGESIIGLFRLKSSSIHRLDLIVLERYPKVFFNYDHCHQLINSSLGSQCEVLLLEIENQIDILPLIGKMVHLQLLTYRCKNATSVDEKTVTMSPAFTQWLKKNLSLTFSMDKDPEDASLIHIEINREETK